MIKVNIAEAKTHFSHYIDSVEQGETIVVCRRNMPIAEVRLVPQSPAKQRPVGIDRELMPIMDMDPVRRQIDDAIANLIGLPQGVFTDLSTTLAREPNIHVGKMTA